MGWGFRHFLFEADGTMRPISHRVAHGVISGSDYLPQYAGFRQRHASVVLEVEDKKPVRIAKIETSKSRVDYTGSIPLYRGDLSAQISCRFCAELNRV
jgi:hypothetical protein